MTAYTLDPAKGQTLASFMKARPVLVAGDYIELLAGDHGAPVITGLNPGRVTIIGRAGNTVGATVFSTTSNWLVRGVNFRAVNPTPGAINFMVRTDVVSTDIGFDACTFSTVEDASAWSPADWVNLPYHTALILRGPRMACTNSRFFNVRNCLSASTDNGWVSGNTMEDFGCDGIDFGANWLRIENNTIRNCRHSAAEPLHADGMQGMPAPNGGTFANISITGNTIEAGPYCDYMQGLDIFDGRWAKITLKGNTIKVGTWNAIAMYGIDGITITGNTVVATNPAQVSWIQVTASKEGRLSTKVVCYGNTAPILKLPADAVTTPPATN